MPPTASSGSSMASRCCSRAAPRASTLDLERLVLKVVDVVDGDWQAAGVHRPRRRPTARSRTCWSRCRSGRSRWRWACSTTIRAPTFESAVIAQNAQAAEGKTPNLQKLLSPGADLAGREAAARHLACCRVHEDGVMNASAPNGGRRYGASVTTTGQERRLAAGRLCGRLSPRARPNRRWARRRIDRGAAARRPCARAGRPRGGSRRDRRNRQLARHPPPCDRRFGGLVRRLGGG